MTASEVFTAIENQLGNLNLRDALGEPVPGDEAYGYLERISAGRWGGMLDELGSDSISLEQFHSEAMEWIEKIKRQAFWVSLEARFVELDKDQRELDLLVDRPA